ncbi:replication initiator protein A [Clostridium sporogenes]|uniref:replication initiator protein A n=1 Tax=Clostridium sporogenes TaxID=1509 RepID=UPI000717A4B9|nr:replication initiator protein A [Clostridium sporogenes]KRU40024.1 replication initiator protein A [Clostridium sporogenes]MBY7065161.1 replication initiator protein A [Clostridium sporogenes]MBY7071793.1 replication initiator protein A [Clostridium sporogenes]OQP88578.1 replication initiator protein A [Clostridium sporogenes]UCA39366.1 replication initiator protein A [Clostridium sporogenes]
MGTPIKVSDLNETKFYQLPKSFFHNPTYINMKNESKLAYSILRDLLDLSIKNNWINEKNEVYVKLSRVKLMRYLNIKGTQKMTQVMKELIEKELIIERQIGLKKCNEIYVCIPKELNKIYSDDELLEYDTFEEEDTESVDNTLTFENQKSKALKIKNQEFLKSKVKSFENQTYTNTNTINTNTINTNNNTTTSSSSSSNTKKQDLYKIFENKICGFTKGTKKQFEYYIKKYNYDFLLAVLEYSYTKAEIRSFKGFKKVIDSYIEKNILTREDLLKDIEKWYKNNSKPKKNTYISTNKVDRFNDFEQRNYDFKELEKKLLGWDNND